MFCEIVICGDKEACGRGANFSRLGECVKSKVDCCDRFFRPFFF